MGFKEWFGFGGGDKKEEPTPPAEETKDEVQPTMEEVKPAGMGEETKQDLAEANQKSAEMMEPENSIGVEENGEK